MGSSSFTTRMRALVMVVDGMARWELLWTSVLPQLEMERAFVR